jgi:hypothetical protein
MLHNEALALHGVEKVELIRTDFPISETSEAFSTTRIVINGGEFQVDLFHTDQFSHKSLPVSLKGVAIEF